MKGLLILVFFFLAINAFASTVNYPVKNFQYISENQFHEEVTASDKYVVMFFSSNRCLLGTNVGHSCFLLERKFDSYVPSFSPNVKVVAFNTFNENETLVSAFRITDTPTVVIIKNNQIMERIEPKVIPADIPHGRMGWQDEFLVEVLNVIKSIR